MNVSHFFVLRRFYGLINRAVALTFFLALHSVAQPQTPDEYDRVAFMIPMRDGTRLHTVIFTPKSGEPKLPILLCRTPYGVDPLPSPEKNQAVRELALDKYIFVYQDIRGKYLSEGEFKMLRPKRDLKKKGSVDETTDAYDTINWLVSHTDNNGRVGMYGGSYDAWEAIMATLEPHPALKAISEQATPADMFIGDDFHHNGAFRLSYGFEYAFSVEASKKDSLFPLGVRDTYDWYLHLGPLGNVNKLYFFGRIPTWNDFIHHPNYDDFWRKRGLAHIIRSLPVPVLNVAGWWDQEDFYGPLTAYHLWEKSDPKKENFLVIGPWNHGGWSHGPGKKLGKLNFDSLTANTYRKNIQEKWFAYYLKGRGRKDFPAVTTFQTGSNTWKTYDQWPPPQAVKKRLYLQENGALSFLKPAPKDKPYDRYLSDPANPVPYRSPPIEQTYTRGSRWSTWLTEDQRFLGHRPDVVSWQTDTLDRDLTVSGNIAALLFASTDHSDADWVVKLIDVYPAGYPRDTVMAGYQLMVAADILRGRFRESLVHPRPVTPYKVERYPIDLHCINHVFKKGHRIMVQIQSSWFPVIDRNPQKYVPNIFEAKAADFVSAIHSVYHSPQYPSFIELSVTE